MADSETPFTVEQQQERLRALAALWLSHPGNERTGAVLNGLADALPQHHALLAEAGNAWEADIANIFAASLRHTLDRIGGLVQDSVGSDENGPGNYGSILSRAGDPIDEQVQTLRFALEHAGALQDATKALFALELAEAERMRQAIGDLPLDNTLQVARIQEAVRNVLHGVPEDLKARDDHPDAAVINGIRERLERECNPNARHAITLAMHASGSLSYHWLENQPDKEILLKAGGGNGYVGGVERAACASIMNRITRAYCDALEEKDHAALQRFTRDALQEELTRQFPTLTAEDSEWFLRNLARDVVQKYAFDAGHREIPDRPDTLIDAYPDLAQALGRGDPLKTASTQPDMRASAHTGAAIPDTTPEEGEQHGKWPGWNDGDPEPDPLGAMDGKELKDATAKPPAPSPADDAKTETKTGITKTRLAIAAAGAAIGIGGAVSSANKTDEDGKKKGLSFATIAWAGLGALVVGGALLWKVNGGKGAGPAR